MYRNKRRRVDDDKPKKTITSVNKKEFYVGTKRWCTIEKLSPIEDLLKYTQYCFSKIYGLISAKECISIFDAPYEIILQFMCAIMQYNSVFYLFMAKNDGYCKTDGMNKIKYKVIENANLTLAECVRYNSSDGIFYFNDQLVKTCLKYSSQNVDINFAQESEDSNVDFEYHSSQKDTVELDSGIANAMYMLFLIAEHAVLHLVESSNPDYINHSKMKESTLFTYHTHVKIREVGNIRDILRKFKEEPDQILAI